LRVRSSSPEPVKEGVTQSILLMGGSGFPLDRVLSDNVDEFTCKICSEFCEQPVVTLCENKHIFCLACLDEWFRNEKKCPTCQEQMKYGTDARYETLKEHSPVLSRVYEKVRVRCPMDDACDWIGSCSEITKHMTSTDAHKKKTTTTSKTSKTTTKTTTRGNSDAKKEENDDTADGLQKQALNKFEAKQYRDAVQLCSKCLSIDKDSAKALHLRGRCWSQLGAFHEAIKDFKECQAVAEGKENNEYAIACAQSLMGMYRKTGDYEASVLAGEEILKRGLKIENETLEEEVARIETLEEEVERMRYVLRTFQSAEEDEREKRYAQAVERYAHLLELDCGERCEIARARCLLSLGENLTQILKFTLDAIRRDDSRVDMHALRGRALCLTADGDFENGIKFFKHALTQNPDDTKTMRLFKDAKKIKVSLENARAAHQNREFAQAVESFTEALESTEFIPEKSPVCARILVERANSYLRLNEAEKCAADARKALSAVDDYKPAYFTLSNAYLKLKEPKKAKDVLENLQKILPDDAETKARIEKCNFEVRKLNRCDYYALLGVTSLASPIEVKQAYKKKAMEYHPDRIPIDATDEEKSKAETNFKLLGEALEILEDELSKRLYDEGYDKEAIQERVEAAKRSAFNRQHSHHGGCGSHHH